MRKLALTVAALAAAAILAPANLAVAQAPHPAGTAHVAAFANGV